MTSRHFRMLLRSTLEERNLNRTREAWAQELSRKNLEFRLVQLPEIRHSLHQSINQSINKLYVSTVVIKAEKLMGPSQKKRRNTKLL